MTEHSRLLNAIKLHAASLDGQVSSTHYGKIVSVGPDGVSAKVRIMPDNVLTGWLPVGSVSVGANSIISPPNIGDMVELTPHEGDGENWVVTGRIFSTASPAPKSPATGNAIAPGEVAIITGSGSYLHFAADGNVWGKAAVKWTLIGDLHVTGEIFDVHGSVDRLRGNYNLHRHAGGATTDRVDPE